MRFQRHLNENEFFAKSFSAFSHVFIMHVIQVAVKLMIVCTCSRNFISGYNLPGFLETRIQKFSGGRWTKGWLITRLWVRLGLSPNIWQPFITQTLIEKIHAWDVRHPFLRFSIDAWSGLQAICMVTKVTRNINQL